MTANGKCLCGAVGFSIELPTKWVAHCHCTQCRRAHGAAFVTFVGVKEEQFSLHDPAGALKWFQSSPEAQRGFCSQCGSTLFFRSTKWPGEMHIARANFVDPLDRLPQAHVYYDTHVDWVTVTDDLPKKP
ncbi:MAG TPA: GFA family protein [Paucimonas sp.]|nr:GFA family protein [Paucimonas sp.]